MKILALEPFYGGSHKAFLDGWLSHSRHRWTLLTLPATKWKWRMRQAAITFADEVNNRVSKGESWDVLFCTDMLNLAEFLGLVNMAIKQLPAVVYFHENQLTYPDRNSDERDYHFAMTNLTTCLAADQVWFNSDFHLQDFLNALPLFLQCMPDYHLPDASERIQNKSYVFPQAINEFTAPAKRQSGPMRIVWAARWEYDKNPGDFFEALKIIKKAGIVFRLSVIGEQYEDIPEVFDWAKDHFSSEIDRWGFLKSRDEYIACLSDADVIVSTADHEFFGISVVEAIACGAYPLLPNRLSYPEILGVRNDNSMMEYLYDGSPGQLADKLNNLAQRLENSTLWENHQRGLPEVVNKFLWSNMQPKLDNALEKMPENNR